METMYHMYYFTMEVMAVATSMAGRLRLLLEVHVFHMFKFYPVILSTRISALVDDFGVVCSGLWTAVNLYNIQIQL